MAKVETNIDNLANEYIKFATMEGKSKLSGDYRTGNFASKQLENIINLVREDPVIQCNVIRKILSSESRRAQSLGAVDALRLNIFVEEAIHILEEDSLQHDILGFGSEMALRIWRGEIPGKTL